jgi:hypothetical protein
MCCRAACAGIVAQPQTIAAPRKQSPIPRPLKVWQVQPYAHKRLHSTFDFPFTWETPHWKSKLFLTALSCLNLLRMQVFGSGIGDDIDDDIVVGDVSLRSHSRWRVLPLAWYYISTFLTKLTTNVDSMVKLMFGAHLGRCKVIEENTTWLEMFCYSVLLCLLIIRPILERGGLMLLGSEPGYGWGASSNSWWIRELFGQKGMNLKIRNLSFQAYYWSIGHLRRESFTSRCIRVGWTPIDVRFGFRCQLFGISTAHFTF